MHLFKILVVSGILLASNMSMAATKIVVSHPEIEAPTFIDHGKPGQSIGDVRIWQFEAKANDGRAPAARVNRDPGNRKTQARM